MIRRAVYSYYNSEGSFGERAGFWKFSDLLYTTALSLLCASRHFQEVQFISTDWGCDMMRELGMPVTHYSSKLNDMKGVSQYFWAYGKLLAYNEQTEPFVHIDNDVFLWDPLPDRILKAHLCFQSHEPFDKEGYKYYEMLRPCFDKAPVKPQIIEDNPVYDFAYNCGICGGHNLDFFKEWIECSQKYIFAHENHTMFFKRFATVLIHQNLFHEQYFAASLIKAHDLRGKVKVLDKDAMVIGEKYRYTHLWGTTKTDKIMMVRVRMRLHDEDRELFNRIDNFCIKNKI